ncbi:hypothetical protein [Mycobacterium sp.]|uniref:hypothetical protein n=1 Tax=Mycobacterium sp. TaxID=1785 RepID=UPI003F9C911D
MTDLDRGDVVAWVSQGVDANTVIPAAQMKTIIPDTTDQFWNALRHKGGGPVYRKVGRKVFYKLADVYAWLDANAYERTDRPVNA